ncbi:MAG: hypothetical protein V4543_16805 [Bacteroidota bacterium]
MNHSIALAALNMMALGTTALTVTYAALNSTGKDITKKDDSVVFFKFIRKQRMYILSLFGIFFILNLATTSYTYSQMEAGNSAAFGISAYSQMFSLGIGGILILTFLVYQGFSWTTELFGKMLFTFLLVIAAFISYNPIARFGFLSWSIALGVMTLRKVPPIRKTLLYCILGPLAALMFAYAGNTKAGTSTQYITGFWPNVEAAYERIQKGEDENMLDGMMMIMQVYPEYLPFSYGMEHLEILMRPIPRAWWPGKPLGSYINKLGLTENMKGGTVGISPSLYGTFWAEGAAPGIAICGIIYGIIFIRLYRFTDKYDSNLGYIMRGMIMASTLALLRGGDLPGIFAFIGMTYWPVILFTNRYTAFIARHRFREKVVKWEILRNEQNNLVRKQEEAEEERRLLVEAALAEAEAEHDKNKKEVTSI